MAATQEQIEELRNAIRRGAVLQSMTVGGQTFVFRSLDEMRRLLADWERQLANEQAGGAFRFAVVDKGY